jgi:hypothetical protein
MPTEDENGVETTAQTSLVNHAGTADQQRNGAY